MKVFIVLATLATVAITSSYSAPATSTKAPEKPEKIELDIIANKDNVAVLIDDPSRIKRSGGFDIFNTIKNKITHGITSKISQFSAGSSGGHGHDGHEHDAYNPYEHAVPHTYDHKSFDWLSLKKSIINTLFQAVKAITGGTIAIKGQLIKGGGQIISTKGKIISTKGDAITSLGKHIATNALLVKPGGHHAEEHHDEHHVSAGYAYSTPTAHAGGAVAIPGGFSTPAAHYGSPVPSGPTYQSHGGGYSQHEVPSNQYIPQKYYASYEGNKGTVPDAYHAGLVILKPIQPNLNQPHSGVVTINNGHGHHYNEPPRHGPSPPDEPYQLSSFSEIPSALIQTILSSSSATFGKNIGGASSSSGNSGSSHTDTESNHPSANAVVIPQSYGHSLDSNHAAPTDSPSPSGHDYSSGHLSADPSASPNLFPPSGHASYPTDQPSPGYDYSANLHVGLTHDVQVFNNGNPSGPEPRPADVSVSSTPQPLPGAGPVVFPLELNPELSGPGASLNSYDFQINIQPSGSPDYQVEEKDENVTPINHIEANIAHLPLENYPGPPPPIPDFKPLPDKQPVDSYGNPVSYKFIPGPGPTYGGHYGYDSIPSGSKYYVMGVRPKSKKNTPSRHPGYSIQKSIVYELKSPTFMSAATMKRYRRRP